MCPSTLLEGDGRCVWKLEYLAQVNDSEPAAGGLELDIPESRAARTMQKRTDLNGGIDCMRPDAGPTDSKELKCLII